MEHVRAMGAWPDNPPPDRQTSRLPEEADHLRLPGRGGHPPQNMPPFRRPGAINPCFRVDHARSTRTELETPVLDAVVDIFWVRKNNISPAL